MAFTLRKMFGIGYFKEPNSDHRDDESIGKKRRRSSNVDMAVPQTSNQQDKANILTKTASEPVKYVQNNPKDITNISPQEHSKKLRLDCEDEEDNPYANCVIEHTPQKVTLGLNKNDFCGFDFDFDQSVDNIFQFDSSKSNELNSDIESLSDKSPEREKSSIPMCRKVSRGEVAGKLRRSVSDDDFSDIESDRNEDQRISLLLSYQMKIEKADKLIRRLLTEFQFHIEVSKVFSCKSHITTLPGGDVSKIPKMLGDAAHIDGLSPAGSPSGSWNIVVEKEDALTKLKLRDQLMSIKEFIQDFVDACLQTPSEIQLHVPSGNSTMAEHSKPPRNKVRNESQLPTAKKIRVNRRKREKRMNDFPDLREVLHNLFSLEGDHSQSLNASISASNVTALMTDLEESSRCNCRCPEHDASVKSTDSGLAKPDERSDTIASSIGDFTLDNSQLTAYSESLEHIISYNSFNDSSLIVAMLQKSAIERITFYVQVHGIQMMTKQDEVQTSDIAASENQPDDSIEARNILFTCAACRFETPDERGLLRHILSHNHCVKIHFLYKTAYIKRCFTSGEEIKPSTVLNSMTMYRDVNKIVCFGDSKFACSLCFENGIVGESVLMAHCYEKEHVEKRNRLDEVLDDKHE